jgi:hypothetical protein
MIDPSFRGLIDSTGVVTGIGLSLTGYVKGDDRGSDDLRGDYLFINAIGNPESDLEWTIDGLTPGGAYALFVYGSDRNRGDWTMRVSGAADQRVSRDSGTAYFANLMADAAGTIRGSMNSLGPKDLAEANWSGFQLLALDKSEDVPAPDTLLLIAGGLAAARIARRRPLPR